MHKDTHTQRHRHTCTRTHHALIPGKKTSYRGEELTHENPSNPQAVTMWQRPQADPTSMQVLGGRAQWTLLCSRGWNAPIMSGLPAVT